MSIKLSDHFTYRKLFRFTIPTIIMMVFVSIYGVVDGFFVSNFAGETEFTAVNFVYPVLMILGAVGFMVGAGGSALIGKNLGKGRTEKANRIFSLFVYLTIVVGAVLAAITIVFLRPIVALLGAEGKLLEDCVLYGRIILLALPAQMLQFEFQSFFVTAEKPKLGLWFTLAAGCTNMLLDLLLVAVFPMGLVGAAIATAVSQVVGGVLPLVYFFRQNNSSLLRLGKTSFDGKSVLKALGNGSSEFLANVAMSVVSILYNAQLMRYAGEPGVAAYGVLMYVNFTFLSCLIGYSVGIAPVVSYHYGAKSQEELKNVFQKSLTVVAVMSVCMLVAALALAVPVSEMFVGYNTDLEQMTVRGFFIFSFGFLFAGASIFASSFFTALNNGLVSAIISFMRTLVFQVAAVLVLPLVFTWLGGDPLDGIWLSIVVAEVVAALVSVVCIVCKRKQYGYY
ncbi:MAG: MATE family efflux transporter [Clostridia bacterium]|nr:MATE family efflux transporter [Clostridia bacterium]